MRSLSLIPYFVATTLIALTALVTPTSAQEKTRAQGTAVYLLPPEGFVAQAGSGAAFNNFATNANITVTPLSVSEFNRLKKVFGNKSAAKKEINSQIFKVASLSDVDIAGQTIPLIEVDAVSYFGNGKQFLILIGGDYPVKISFTTVRSETHSKDEILETFQSVEIRTSND